MAPSVQKKAKVAKTQRAEFDRVLSDLEKESKELRTSQHQKMLFGATAGWVALAPLYLYVSGLVEATLKDNALVFLLGALATALVLFYVYDVLAAKTRLALIKNSDMSAVADDAESNMQVQKGVSAQAAYYSLWTANATYYVSFALFLSYCFASYDLSAPVKYSLSSLFSSGLVAALVSARAI